MAGTLWLLVSSTVLVFVASGENSAQRGKVAFGRKQGHTLDPIDMDHITTMWSEGAETEAGGGGASSSVVSSDLRIRKKDLPGSAPFIVRGLCCCPACALLACWCFCAVRPSPARCACLHTQVTHGMHSISGSVFFVLENIAVDGKTGRNSLI
jgi:hypothetical protein